MTTTPNVEHRKKTYNNTKYFGRQYPIISLILLTICLWSIDFGFVYCIIAHVDAGAKANMQTCSPLDPKQKAEYFQ